ncbi:MAG: Crp/Fnr family transcriptional regulator [Pseudomonadota bacterium]
MTQNKIQGVGLDQAFVGRMPPFQDMDRDDVRGVLQQATVRRFGYSDTIFEEDDAAGAFFLLADGFVRLLRTTRDGDHVVVHHVGPGDLFGMARAVECDSYSVSAKAASDCLILSWPSAAWPEMIAATPTFLRVSQRTLGARTRELRDKIVEMATRPVEQRIALAILRMTRQAGRETVDGTEIEFPVTRQDISELTGANMHSVSRYMSGWHKAGIVHGSRRRIVVVRPDALLEIALGRTA